MCVYFINVKRPSLYWLIYIKKQTKVWFILTSFQRQKPTFQWVGHLFMYFSFELNATQQKKNNWHNKESPQVSFLVNTVMYAKRWVRHKRRCSEAGLHVLTKTDGCGRRQTRLLCLLVWLKRAYEIWDKYFW